MDRRDCCRVRPLRPFVLKRVPGRLPWYPASGLRRGLSGACSAPRPAMHPACACACACACRVRPLRPALLNCVPARLTACRAACLPVRSHARRGARPACEGRTPTPNPGRGPPTRTGASLVLVLLDPLGPVLLQRRRQPARAWARSRPRAARPLGLVLRSTPRPRFRSPLPARCR